MFLEIAELKSAIYTYQMNQIAENDNDILAMSIDAATQEVKSYLRPNNKKEWKDGRLLYNVDAVFSATGTDRNPLILEMTKSVAVWYLVRLSNVDMLYENIKDRYDRAIDWLKKVNTGDITLDLPLIDESTETNENTTPPFRFGSRKKFRHE